MKTDAIKHLIEETEKAKEKQPDFMGIHRDGTLMSHIASKYFFSYNYWYRWKKRNLKIIDE